MLAVVIGLCPGTVGWRGAVGGVAGVAVLVVVVALAVAFVAASVTTPSTWNSPDEPTNPPATFTPTTDGGRHDSARDAASSSAWTTAAWRGRCRIRCPAVASDDVVPPLVPVPVSAHDADSSTATS